jgi:hypothetical protein
VKNFLSPVPPEPITSDPTKAKDEKMTAPWEAPGLTKIASVTVAQNASGGFTDFGGCGSVPN